MNLKKASMPTRKAFALRMEEMGALDKDFAVFESDIGYSTYSYLFGESYPERYFNMGLAEGNTISSAAGMASCGRTVIVCGYGVFITLRAVEAIRTYVCYPNLDVKFLSSHGGLTAAIDGVTHQATEDIAYMTTLPNMKVLVPCDTLSAKGCFDLALKTPGPVFVRLMRDPLYEVYNEGAELTVGGSTFLRTGKDITIVGYGDTVFQALEAAEILSAQGIEAEVMDAYSIKPFDREGFFTSVKKTKSCLVVENHQRRNGLGYEIATLLLAESPVPFDILGLRDTFAESGNYNLVMDKYGLSAACIVEAAKRITAKK